MYQTLSDAQRGAAPSLVMGYKDIVTHLDGTPEDDIRLAHGESVAALFNAHLTGVYTNRLPDIADYSSPAGLMACVEAENQLRAEGEVVRKRLAQRFEKLSVPNGLRKIDAMPGDMRRAVATEVRCADLFVASCPRNGAATWNSLVEEALFQGGHGVLLAPEGVRPRVAIQTAVIGWVNSREAARAVAEALPLLRLATSAHIVCVEQDAAPVIGAMALAGVAEHLDRHGVRVNVNVISHVPQGNRVKEIMLL